MGARISAHRKNKGLTQEALANTLGVSNQAVSKWESDVCCPDIALLPQLVDALEMTLDELFGRESKAAIANDQILPVAAELPWEDDDSIHAVLFQGHRLLQPKEGSLFRRDKYDEIRKSVELHFSGTAQDIYSDFSVVCTSTTVRGGIQAGDGVTCGDVGGSVQAGDGVTCGDVGGSVRAGDSVTCGSVEGDVSGGRRRHLLRQRHGQCPRGRQRQLRQRRRQRAGKRQRALRRCAGQRPRKRQCALQYRRRRCERRQRPLHKGR